METMLDVNVFNPFNEPLYEDMIPLFDNDYIIDTHPFSGGPVLFKENYYVKKDTNKRTQKRKPIVQTTATAKKKRALAKNSTPKTSSKPLPSEILDGKQLYCDEMDVLNEIFLSDIFMTNEQSTELNREIPLLPKREPKRLPKQEKAKPKAVKRTSSNTKTKSRSPTKAPSPKSKVAKSTTPKAATTSATESRKLPALKTTKKERSTRNDRNSSSRKRPRNRMKWSKEENLKLWESISRNGNNWTEIKKDLGDRTYYQIKDKGRRLLSVQGWISGRNKKYSHEAMYSAKLIAHSVLSQKIHERTVPVAA